MKSWSETHTSQSSQSTRVLRSQSKELSKRSSIPPSEAGRNSTKNQTSTQALHGSVVPLPASAPGRPYEPKDLTQLVDDLARSYSRLSPFQRHAQRIFWLTVPALFEVLRYFRKNLKHVVWRVLCILFWVLGITAVLILLTHISLALSFVKKLMTLLWRTLAFWNWLDDFLDAVSNPSSIPNVLTSALYQVKNLTMQSIFDASDFFSGSLSSLWNSANHTLTWFTTMAVPLGWSSASWSSPIVTFNVSQNMSETLSFYGQTAYQGLMLHDAPDHLYKARRCMMELGELAARAQTEFVKEEIFQKGEAWLREEQKSRRTVRHFFNENILGVNLVIMSSDFALRALNEIERSYNQSSSFINMFRGGRRDEEILEVLQRYVEQVKTRTETLLSFAVTTNLALENLQQNLSVITYAAIHEEVKTSNRLKSIQRKWNRKFVPWTSSPEQDLADQLALIEKIVQAPRAAQMHLGFLIRNLEATHDRIERLAGFLAVNITRDYFTRENSAQMIGVISHGAAELRQTSEIGAQMRQRGQQREVAGYN